MVLVINGRVELPLIGEVVHCLLNLDHSVGHAPGPEGLKDMAHGQPSVIVDRLIVNGKDVVVQLVASRLLSRLDMMGDLSLHWHHHWGARGRRSSSLGEVEVLEDALEVVVGDLIEVRHDPAAEGNDTLLPVHSPHVAANPNVAAHHTLLGILDQRVGLLYIVNDLNGPSPIIQLEFQGSADLRSLHDAAHNVKCRQVNAIDAVLVITCDLLENLMDGDIPHCLSHRLRALHDEPFMMRCMNEVRIPSF